MKTLLKILVLFCLTLVSLVPAFAQITITSGDLGAYFSPGNTITSRVDTVTKTANIGGLGATSWNFSTLNTNFTETSTSVRPDTTPFFSLFPGSTHAQRIVVAGVGIGYIYYKLGTNLLSTGLGVTGELFQVRIRNVPDEVTLQLPMTSGTTWTTTYAESSIVTQPPPLPPQITISNRVLSNTVEAYGNLTLPGGAVYPALRLKTDRRITSSGTYTRLIMYSFYANNGATVSVSAADTLQPNTGTIKVSSISWNGPVGSATSVGEISEGNLPSSFALEQNYPNPFNPSTKIQFQIPEARFVRLKVYNLLGQEVATLVNEHLEAGRYRAEFDASKLPSGTYLYRLQAGNFTEVKKMAVVK